MNSSNHVNKHAIELSIVVPCFNEEKSIELVLERFKKAIKASGVEVIMVDNGSIDASGQIIKALLPKYPFAKSVTVKKNIGYGNGILEGLKVANGKYLGWTHADLQTDPQDVAKALKIIKQASRDDLFVKGWRKGRPIGDQVFSAFMAIYVSFALGKMFKEVNAQPTIFSRKFYETFKNPPKDFSLDLYVYYLAKLSKQKIVRFNVLFPKRLHGQSSWNTSFRNRIKLTLRAMRYTKELKKILHDIRRP